MKPFIWTSASRTHKRRIEGPSADLKLQCVEEMCWSKVWATLANRFSSRQVKSGMNQILHKSPEITDPRQIRLRFQQTKRFSLPQEVLKQTNFEFANIIASRQVKSSINEILHQVQKIRVRGKYKPDCNNPKRFLWDVLKQNMSYFGEQNCIKASEIKCPQNSSPKSRKRWSKANTSQI